MKMLCQWPKTSILIEQEESCSTVIRSTANTLDKNFLAFNIDIHLHAPSLLALL